MLSLMDAQYKVLFCGNEGWRDPSKWHSRHAQSGWWRHAKSRFLMPPLLPTATPRMIVKYCKYDDYESQVAEVAVFLRKKSFQKSPLGVLPGLCA